MCAAILFIDDYEPASTIMRFIVEDMGHKFEYARSGDEALQQVQQSKFDIALVDINLPKYEGHILAQELRNVSKNKNIHLIAYTADAKGVSEEQAAHFDAIEQKSLKSEETASLIINALNECRQVA